MPISLMGIGLLLDIFGAVVIALPDFPYVRRFLPSGKLKAAMVEMEAGGLTPQNTGYHQMVKFLEGYYSVRIPRDIDGLRVGGTVLSKFGRDDVYIVYSDTDTESLAERSERNDASYTVVKSGLQNTIDLFQAIIRGIGFLALISGFALQAWSVM